jgi:hypothetical protein
LTIINTKLAQLLDVFCQQNSDAGTPALKVGSEFQRALRAEAGPCVLFHLEAAGRPWPADATFSHRCANYLSEQRFRQQTCFGMICRGGSDWTAVPIDEVPAIFLAKNGGAAQVLENAQRSINSLLPGFAFQLMQMFLGYGSPSGTHSGAQISWLNLPGEY